MHDQIEGMIEGADRNDNANRLQLGKRDAIGAGSGDAHRDHLAGIGAQGLDTDFQTIDGASDFDLGVRQGLAAFAGGFHRQHLGTLADQRLRLL